MFKYCLKVLAFWRLALLEDILSESISMFTNLIKKRVKVYGEEFLYPSRESLMTFLYVYSLIRRNPELIDRVFLDYPFTKEAGSRGEFDVYIDVDPGCYIEVKYIRPIPSGMNIPLPQHRGSLINDLIRLAYKTPAKANRYLFLIELVESSLIIYQKSQAFLSMKNLGVER